MSTSATRLPAITYYTGIRQCGPDGRCLTCGGMATCTAGCTACSTVTVVDTIETQHMGCIHGRYVGQPCPHCLGL